MDTVSMLNKMSFYCQPILPLVYDESMSYYETLRKVVGQLNTTGETVNKLNEDMTGEISDRQAADAALDARIKEIEKTNKKIHFLKVDTLGHLLTENVTREKLSQWVQDGDIIAMLYAPDEQENSWAVATNYRCLGTRGAETMQLSFYVPISIVHNAGKSGTDVAQEVVVISLPVGELTNQWVVRSITTTIPATNADGFVNLMASVGGDGAVTCDVEPGAIVEALRNYFRSTNQFAVAVNARLNYDGKQYHSSAATVKADASGAGNIRIAFENYYGGVRVENGVSQTVNTTIFLVGDVKTNAWSVETIDHKSFDFPRYVGFQFTRGAHNVITTDDESTPNAVYTQYHANESGKLYQNLPTRLIDTVDNTEYWNGVFDIKDNKHMTFTFVTSNYATASDKMLVRVIELSADVNTTTWKYAEKEFTIPLSDNDALYVDFWPTGSEETYNEELKAYVVELASNKTFDEIYDSIKAGHKTVARLYQDEAKSDFPDSSVDANISGNKNLGTINFHFLSVGSNNIAGFAFIGEVITLIKTSSSTLIYIILGANVLPVPNGDGTDNGKVPTVNGTRWEMKKAVVDNALSDTSINPVQNKVVKAALDGKASTEVASQTANGLMSAKDKTKLDGIEEGATRVIVDDAMSGTSTNPVQNKVVMNYIDSRGTLPPVSTQNDTMLIQVVNGAYALRTKESIFPVDDALDTESKNAVENGVIARTIEIIQGHTQLANGTRDGLMSASDYNKLLNIESGATRTIVDSALDADSTNPVQNKVVKTALDGKAGTAVASASANGLMSKDDKAKLDDVEAGANKTIVDAALDAASENPVQNKAVKAALDGKLDKTGGTLTGNLRVTGALFSGDGLSFGTGENIHFTKAADDAGKLAHGAAGVDDTVPLARLKVATPTEDDDAATKAYVDNNAAGAGAVRYDAAQTLEAAQQFQARQNINAAGVVMPQFQGFLTIAPANEPIGTGVGLSPSGSGNDFTLDISDVNEGTPTLLTGVKTPTDTDANAAATVEYVNAKVASGGSSDFVVNGTGSSDGTITLDKTFTQIREAALGGKSVLMRIAAGNEYTYVPLTQVGANYCVFQLAISERNSIALRTVAVNSNNAITQLSSIAPTFNSDGTLPQATMYADPIEAMQIATKQYVDDKVKKAVVIDVSQEEVQSYNYSDIDSEITNGSGNVWLSLGTNQMRMVAYDKPGASSYELTFVNLVGNSFNIHTITVSPRAASYIYITK